MNKTPLPFLIIRSGDDGALTDLHSQLAIASAYARTAHIAALEGERVEATAMAFPAFICSSFALELFMKLLIVRSQIALGQEPAKVKGHNVRSLWEKIAEADKAVVAGFFKYDAEEPRASAATTLRQIFEKAIAGLPNEPFVDWRYVHERKGVDVLNRGDLEEVMDAFGRAAAYLLRQDETDASEKHTSA